MGSAYAAQLAGLLQTSRNASDPAAKVTLIKLRDQIKERLARGSPEYEFFVEVSRGLARIKGTAHADYRMDCMFHCAQFFYFDERNAEALQTLQHLAALASRAAKPEWKRKASHMLGVVLADSGDIAASVPQYCLAYDLARELADPFSETAVLINLGVALNYGGLYREAIPCFRRAIASSSSAPELRALRSPALTNLAQSHVFLGEFEEALVAIDQALAAGDDPVDAVSASSRAIREFTYVQIALELGHLESAKSHAHQCAYFGRLGGMAKGLFLAEIASSLCEIYSGNVATGLESLEAILQRCGNTPTREVALTALVKAFDEAEQSEQSLMYLEALIAHVRAARKKGIEALLGISRPLTHTLSTEEHDLRAYRFQEAKLRAKVAEHKAFNAQIDMLERFAVTADLRDEISGEHGYRVGRLCALLARELHWSKDAISALELGARLHDIGKVGIPDRILLNSSGLRQIERHFVCAHTAIGAELLGRSSIPHVRIAEDIARYHHEWWDGEGYPSKLAGDRIPVHARIVALADVFDALTHGRPYSQPWSFEQAVAEIALLRGTQFDPILTDLFLGMVTRLSEEHESLDEFLGRGASSRPFAQARSKIRMMLLAERDQAQLDSQVEGV